MKQILICILLIALLILPNSKAHTNYDIFIKINATPNTESLLTSTPFIKIVLKMKGYYIALAYKKDLEKYENKSIEYQILSTYKPNYSYFLLKYQSIDSLIKIRMQGDLIILENGISFFVYKATNQPPKLPRDISLIAIPFSEEKLPKLLPTPIITEKYSYIPKKEIIDILSKVSLNNYKNNIQTLQNFKTRYYNREGCKKAADFIFNYFQNLGLLTEYQSFFIYNEKTQNIIATQYGVSDPDSIIIIAAHYDSYSYDVNNAPGADDNASGTAAVMEAARILKNYQFDFTIRYIAFGAEEIGLYGSAYYASNASQQNEKIIGVLNLDMISYVDFIPEDINIVSNEKSSWLGEMFTSLTEAYTNVRALNTIDPSFRWSDHSSFWHANYSAILAIEDLNISNPFYHSPADTLDTLSLNFAIETTKAAIANVITLAQLYDSNLPKPPKDILIKPVYSYSLFDSRKHILLSWNPNNSNIIGFNIYKTNISHLNYSKLNSSPITEPFYTDHYQPPNSSFYYVITSISPDYIESHFSAEVY